MAQRVSQQDSLSREVRYVAGVDIAYTQKKSIGAVALMELDSLSLIEFHTVCTKTKFPYISTLLSFREVPPAASVMEALELQPDVVIADGHGIMHPYRFGFACHLGLILGKPTIGVAKRPLIGEVGQLNDQNWAPVMDRDDVVGVAMIAAEGIKPIYISIGHMISLGKAIEVIKRCSSAHRIPKPLSLAHSIAKKAQQTMEEEKCASLL